MRLGMEGIGGGAPALPDRALGISPSFSSGGGSCDGAGSATSCAGDGWGDAANDAGFVEFAASAIPHSAFTAVVPAPASPLVAAVDGWDATAHIGVSAAARGAGAAAAAAASTAAAAAAARPVKGAAELAREEREREEYLARLNGKLAALRTGGSAAVGARFMASSEARRAVGRGTAVEELELRAFSRELAATNDGPRGAASATRRLAAAGGAGGVAAVAGAGARRIEDSAAAGALDSDAGGAHAHAAGQERTRLVTALDADGAMLSPLTASAAPPSRGAAHHPTGVARLVAGGATVQPPGRDDDGDDDLDDLEVDGGWGPRLLRIGRAVCATLGRWCGCA